MQLHRYWVTFDSHGQPPSSEVVIGCGVTAYDQDDALRLLQEHVFRDREFPKIVAVVPDVDISKIDDRHVASHIENPVWYGIWFPRGYKGLR